MIDRELRWLAHEHGYRLCPGSKDGLLDLHDAATGHLEAEDLTVREVRLLCAGLIELGQVRQPPR
jgi:hypothetical protein